jgi:hypothetical protein
VTASRRIGRRRCLIPPISSCLYRRWRAERRVCDENKVLVNHAVYLRGNIITSYAHIEFLLADICLKAWQLPEYAHFAGAFPYKTDSRIKAARALFEGEGPLKQYREGIQPALDELLDFEELRHFVAHGLLIVNATLEYRLYRTTKQGTAIAFMETSASDLDGVALEIERRWGCNYRRI